MSSKHDTLATIGEIGLRLQQLAPLAIAGVEGAVTEIESLIEGLHSADLKTALEDAAETGHAQVAKLAARAKQARDFMASQGQT
jgi:hypothetical protein